MTGGLRWDRFDVDYDRVAVDGVVTPFERTDDMVSWRAGVVYKPRPNGSIYLGYGTSFNPSAEGLALSAAHRRRSSRRRRGASRSAPSGTCCGERLSLTAAVFRTEKTNARTPGINPGDPPTVLAGEQRVDGVELGVSGQHHAALDGVRAATRSCTARSRRRTRRPSSTTRSR